MRFHKRSGGNAFSEIWVVGLLCSLGLWGKRVVQIIQRFSVFNEPNYFGAGAKNCKCLELEPDPEICVPVPQPCRMVDHTEGGNIALESSFIAKGLIKFNFFWNSRCFNKDFCGLCNIMISCSQRRNKGGKIPRAPNYFGGVEWLRGAPKSPNNVASTLLNNTFASERPQVGTWGRHTSFLPWAPSNLVTPLGTANAVLWRFSIFQGVQRKQLNTFPVNRI